MQDENLISNENPPQEIDENLTPAVTDLVSRDASLALSEQDILAKILDAPNRDELQKQFELFNINQSKKNALRIVKLNELLANVEDQAIERFKKRPDQVSNKELLEYMNVISGQIDRAQKHIDSISTAPPISLTANKTDVTINVGADLDSDSKTRVMDAVAMLLSQVKAATAQHEVTEFEDKTAESDDIEILDADTVCINKMDSIDSIDESNNEE